MDTGKMNNYKYYTGYDYEPEVILESDNPQMEILHIWDGFFTFIFGDAESDGNGWNGFTKDYNQCEGAFGDDEEDVITDLQEYIDDMKQYETKQFKFKETKEVYNLLCSWLKEANEKGCKSITVKIN